jgi:hypothetical protein
VALFATFLLLGALVATMIDAETRQQPLA